MSGNSAFVLINCILGQEERVLEEIVKLSPDVKEATATYGVHDIIVRIDTDGADSLGAILVMLRKTPGVTSTVTLNVIPGYGGK